MATPATPSTPDLPRSESRFTFSRRSLLEENRASTGPITVSKHGVAMKHGDAVYASFPVTLQCSHRKSIGTQTDTLSVSSESQPPDDSTESSQLVNNSNC